MQPRPCDWFRDSLSAQSGAVRCPERLPGNPKSGFPPPPRPPVLLVSEPSSPSRPLCTVGGWLGKKGRWRGSGSISRGLHEASSEAAPHVLWTAWLHQPADSRFCLRLCRSFLVTERMIAEREYRVLQVQGNWASFLSGLLRKMSSWDNTDHWQLEFLREILTEASRNSKENGFCVRPKNCSADGVILPSPCLLVCVVTWWC